MFEYDSKIYVQKKNNKVLHFLKFILILAFFGAFFLGGVKFEEWGGINRGAPIVINFLRNNFLGDEFVLKLEKKVFEINDIVKQNYYSDFVDHTVDIVEIGINEKTTDLTRNYLTNYENYSQKDVDKLSAFINNYEENLKIMHESPVEGEGIWEKFMISPETFRPLYSKTFIRTDLKRKFVKVFIYKFDLELLNLEFIPGKDDVEDEEINGRMTTEQRDTVMWIFSGGFQYRHGYYGMKSNNKLLLKPKKGAATLLFYNDGTLKIVEWDPKYLNDENIHSFRQNELMLVINGEVTPNINRLWGLTPKNVDPIYTVRSGLGLTDNNELIFAFGEHLSAQTLAEGMIKAGVINGMHLDMNYYNVHLVNVQKTETGRLLTFNENEILSYFRNIYSYYSPRDYFILTRKKIQEIENKTEIIDINELTPEIKKDIVLKSN